MLGIALSPLADKLRSHFPIIDLKTEYSAEVPVAPINGLLTGEVSGTILASAQFIDTAALAFMAQEMGYCLTTYSGEPMPPLSKSNNYRWPALIVSANETLQQKLIAVMSEIDLPWKD